MENELRLSSEILFENRGKGHPEPKNSPRSIYLNSNMTTRLSGHFSIFGLIFFVLKSLLATARQWSREKIAILSLKPRSHVRILIS